MNYFNYWKTLRILYTKAFRNQLSNKKSLDYQKFMIVGRARSGTTLLHTYLNTHRNIYSAGEVQASELYHDLQTSDIKKRLIFRTFDSSIKVAGAKVLLPVQIQNTVTEALLHIIALSPDIKIIHLHRRNLLREYVSLKIAEKTNKWSEINHKNSLSVNEKQIKPDITEMFRYFSLATEGLQHFRQLFKGTTHFELTYEELSEKPQEAMLRVQNFLQVTPAPTFSLLQRQNPEPPEALIINYHSISKALQGTPYEIFLAAAGSNDF